MKCRVKVKEGMPADRLKKYVTCTHTHSENSESSESFETEEEKERDCTQSWGLATIPFDKSEDEEMHARRSSYVFCRSTHSASCTCQPRSPDAGAPKLPRLKLLSQSS